MGKQLWQRPVFFDRNRVYRVYLGGNCFTTSSATRRRTDSIRKSGSHRQSMP